MKWRMKWRMKVVGPFTPSSLTFTFLPNPHSSHLCKTILGWGRRDGSTAGVDESKTNRRGGVSEE